MATTLIDAGKNPTIPVSREAISGEIVQRIMLCDGTTLTALGGASAPLNVTFPTSPTVDQGTAAASGAGWRVGFYGPTGLPTVNFNIAGVYEVPAVVVGDPFTGSPWNFISGRGLMQQKATAVARLVITASVANQTLLPAQPLRAGASIFNNSASATLYIKYGATASLTSWDDKLFPNQKLEIPFGIDVQVDGIWDAAVGDAHVMECY